MSYVLLVVARGEASSVRPPYRVALRFIGSQQVAQNIRSLALPQPQTSLLWLSPNWQHQQRDYQI